MRKTYKYRLYPAKAQIQKLQWTLDMCRILYNSCLLDRKNAYEKEGRSLSRIDQQQILKADKSKVESLKEIQSQVLQDVLFRVERAYQNFFRRVKAGGEKPGYPRFKGEGRYDSITYPQQPGFKITDEGLRLYKIGIVRIKLHRPIIGNIKTCTIRRKNNKWFACFSVEYEPKPLRKSMKAVGIDVGLETFATLSTKKKIANPRFFKTDEKALAKAQRKLSKQKMKSPERHKAKKVVVRIHERISNRRHNFCHQTARMLVKQFGIICIEDLNINLMKQGNFRSMNRSIGDVAWGQFANYLSYKAENADRTLVKVNPAYTSQTCSACGYRQVKKLSERVHHCSSCDVKLDRDYNASLNILSLGIQTLGIQSLEAPSYL